MEKLDEQLIFETGKGSKVAFRALYSRYSKQMYALVIKTVGSKRQKYHDEVFQEIMLRIWQKAPLFDSNKGKAKSWIYLLATRHIINFLDCKSTRKDSSEKSLEQDIIDFKTSQPEETVLNAEKSQTAMKILEILPDEMRQAVVLRHMENLSINEIAKISNCPPGTIKSRIFNGLRKLKTLFSKEKIYE